MPSHSLFDIHQVIESQHKSQLATPKDTSQFATPKGWLKDTLVLKFDWVGQKTICFIIQTLLNYYIYVPTRIPFELIVFSLGESTESLKDTTKSTQSRIQSPIAALRQHIHRKRIKSKKNYLSSKFYSTIQSKFCKLWRNNVLEFLNKTM
jgi:hypothetical protein